MQLSRTSHLATRRNRTLIRSSRLLFLAYAAPAFSQGIVHDIVVQGGPFGGSAIVSVGDVSGDGVFDIAVGSAGYINAGGGFVTILSGATGDELYQPYIESGDYSAGLSLANLGDVDGDGLADLASGDELWGDSDSRPGGVTVTRGGTGTLLGFIPGEESLDLFGWSVDGVPDVDSDGIGDLVVGAPGSNAAARDAGAVYLISGATRVTLWKRSGSDPGGGLGYVVRGIHDIDGDGRGDVVASAPGETSASGLVAAGRVWFLSGATGAPIRMVDGQAPDEHLGRSLAILGDSNGDQIDDVLVGSPFAGGPTTSAGRVDVVSGADGTVLRSFAGESSGNLLGMHLGPVGDVNADGTEDFAFAQRAYGAVNGETLWKVMSGATGQALFQVLSQHFQLDRRPVAAVGDLTGDGVDNLAIGDPTSRRVRVYQLGGIVQGTVCYGEPNSLNVRAPRLFTSHSSQFSTTLNGVSIGTLSLPASVGYFLVSSELASAPMAGGGRGTLCLGASTLGRYSNQVFQFDPQVSGGVVLQVDNTAIPRSGSATGTVAAVPGDTFYFQYWYRDVLTSGVSSSSLTDALAVTYL